MAISETIMRFCWKCQKIRMSFWNLYFLTWRNVMHPKKIFRKIVIEFWNNICGFLIVKLKKKAFLFFFNAKNFLVHVDRGQFSKKSWKIFKNIYHLGLDGIKIKIVKKFGVHICIFQSTAGDQYQGGLIWAPPQSR